ncbi:MAG TPA: NYN domain-containing protein [Planctomycetes bacterium]|nr:NYN domain-containing protein [Planctomycetota bacterium]HIJ69860.1 NYN domain-containing protein [Planctomycetota bacterium]
MAQRICVFVDGENFRYSIVNLFDQFNSNDYLPKQANWDTLFDWFVSKAILGGERVRTYWYVIQLLDFFPYKFPSAESNPEVLKRLLCKDKWSHSQLKELEGEELTAKMKEIVGRLHHRQNSMRYRFEGWRKLQDGISSRWSRVEFRRAGAITYNLFDDSLGKEKAVDVKLATDLIVLRDIYDVAVIVSGDQDYVPAVQAVKDFGKIVVNVVFRARNGKLLPGGARRLNQLTDNCIEINYDEFRQHLNL